METMETSASQLIKSACAKLELQGPTWRQPANLRNRCETCVFYSGNKTEHQVLVHLLKANSTPWLYHQEALLGRGIEAGMERPPKLGEWRALPFQCTDNKHCFPHSLDSPLISYRSVDSLSHINLLVLPQLCQKQYGLLSDEGCRCGRPAYSQCRDILFYPDMNYWKDVDG